MQKIHREQVGIVFHRPTCAGISGITKTIETVTITSALGILSAQLPAVTEAMINLDIKLVLRTFISSRLKPIGAEIIRGSNRVIGKRKHVNQLGGHRINKAAAKVGG